MVYTLILGGMAPRTPLLGHTSPHTHHAGHTGSLFYTAALPVHLFSVVVISPLPIAAAAPFLWSYLSSLFPLSAYCCGTRPAETSWVVASQTLFTHTLGIRHTVVGPPLSVGPLSHTPLCRHTHHTCHTDSLLCLQFLYSTVHLPLAPTLHISLC